jgi:adenylate cyclase
MAKKRPKIMDARWFGLIIGVVVVGVFLLLNYQTGLLGKLELKVLDTFFTLKVTQERKSLQEGTIQTDRDIKISDDILIVGIDFNSLSKYGNWPFPRRTHADLVNAFSRLKNPQNRERSLFLDIFFMDPDRNTANDALLVESMEKSDRVFLETVLTPSPSQGAPDEELATRQAALYEKWGTIRNIRGDWKDLPGFYGYEPPLEPYGKAAHGYGHANFVADSDKVYRKQPLVVKSSILEDVIRLDDLSPGYTVDESSFERLAWQDTDGNYHNIDVPLTESSLSSLCSEMEKHAPLKIEDADQDGTAEAQYYIVRKFKDTFIPAITLSLALDYFGKTLDDIEVVLGEYILIPSPKVFDTASGDWVPYKVLVSREEYDKDGNVKKKAVFRDVPEIRIPINRYGQMMVNYMGHRSSESMEGQQTYPVRSYAGYAEKAPSTNPDEWRKTMGVANKIVMVGAFASGMAEDEKPTPYGLMYGIEIHANALNTILMDNFIHQAPWWVDTLILFGMVLITAFLVSRLSALIGVGYTLISVVAYFFIASFVFDHSAYLVNYTMPAIATLFTFIAVIVYRALTEEKDKRQMRETFGKYVSPRVVDQLVNNPPELGGEEKELTVLFSDIRGFTTLSEVLSAQQLVLHLNEYFSAMTPIVMDFGGTLDKYIGDAIMCFWGAPLAQPDHAALACKCALAMMDKLKELNASWPEAKRIDIGIGINSGIMVSANMGSPLRMNYTLTGDNVNLGSRLEATNKEYKTHIIISEYTYGLVKDRFLVRELDNIRVKGKNKPVGIYELVDCLESLDPPILEDPSLSRKKKKTPSA